MEVSLEWMGPRTGELDYITITLCGLIAAGVAWYFGFPGVAVAIAAASLGMYGFRQFCVWSLIRARRQRRDENPFGPSN